MNGLGRRSGLFLRDRSVILGSGGTRKRLGIGSGRRGFTCFWGSWFWDYKYMYKYGLWLCLEQGYCEG